MTISDPGMRFFDWEDRLVALPARSVELYRVLDDQTLVPAPESWLLSDIYGNSSELDLYDVKNRLHL